MNAQVKIVVIAMAIQTGTLLAFDVVRNGKPLAGVWFEAAPTNAVVLTDQKAAVELARFDA